MWHLPIITAVAFSQVATATLQVDIESPQLRAGLLCGNYSLDVNQTLFIKSKRFAQNYPKNHECDYTFHCSDYAASIVFNCNKFNLQKSSNCKNDFLRVYDDNAINQKFCGTNPPQNVTTGDNFLGVQFKTNGDSTTDSGFFCSVKCKHVDDKTTTTTTSTPTPSTTSTTTQSTTSTTTVTVPTPVAYSGCRCGIAQRSSRIVGGGQTEVGEYPWHVGLVKDRLMTPYCGGALLNNEFIITSATCANPGVPYKVLLGEHDWLKVSHVVLRNPKTTFIHPDFNQNTKENDIAIIRLDQPVNLNTNMSIKPLCLPDPATDFTDMKGIVTGWGKTSESGTQSSSLQEVEVTVTAAADCESQNSNYICAGEPDGGKDACHFDEGGALTVEVNGRYVLAGVTSSSQVCARAGNPRSYSNAQNSLDWIRATISDGKICQADMIPTTTTTAATTTGASSTSSSDSTSTISSTTPTTTTTAAVTKNPGLQCTCGIPPNPLRADVTSSINNNPWTVALISKSSGKQYCSGAVVNTFFILTAKSCATSISNIQVKANAQDITSTTASRIINRNVVSASIDKDLALLRLDNPLSLTAWDGIKPACLPPTNKDFTNAPSTHSGYGNIYPATNPSNIVTKTDGYLVWCSGLGDHVACFQPKQARGFCGADVGGPIVSVGDDGRSYLSAIALKDNGCSTANGMLIQETAKVSEYYNWIWDGSQDGRFCAL